MKRQFTWPAPHTRRTASSVAASTPACSSGKRSQSDYDLDRPQRELAGALAARGIPALDLLAASRRAAAGGPLYRPRNTHWNAAGNRLAAAELARFLVDERLVPPPGAAPAVSPPRP